MGNRGRPGRPRPGTAAAGDIARFAFAFDAAPDTATQLPEHGLPGGGRAGGAADTELIEALIEATVPMPAAPHPVVPRPREPLDSPTTVMRRVVVPPVFVDESGRRRRLLVVGGWTAITAAAAYVAIVGVSLLHGGAAAPIGSTLSGLLPAQAEVAATEDPTAEDAATTATLVPTGVVRTPVVAPVAQVESPAPTPAKAAPPAPTTNLVVVARDPRAEQTKKPEVKVPPKPESTPPDPPTQDSSKDDPPDEDQSGTPPGSDPDQNPPVSDQNPVVPASGTP